ncbi:hypothetical protein Q75_02830 [Bacillus coahuilensis p1.1.43]|uniref:Uncharacterized protein n=1 Tax=Bacillus coahuilensis p1.1.43 TaxID=1150625 RepID=A0A147KBC6_9BACI|nr:hypothetical protein [Bacillus coahuilensis]KUP08448.1 hypothetical protein Q75_02830 [Bacillus coahuilensis p1.1.43]
MRKNINIEELLENKDKVLIMPTPPNRDKSHFIKVLYNKLNELKHVPNSVLNDFIVITCRCGEFIEFDTNVIRMKSAVIAKKLGITPQTLSTKLTNLERYNLIKRFTDPDTGGFTVVINTNYFYKCTDFMYIGIQKKIFENKTVEVTLIKETIDKINNNKNFSNYKKAKYAEREGRKELEKLDHKRKQKIIENDEKIAYLENEIAKLKRESEYIN